MCAEFAASTLFIANFYGIRIIGERGGGALTALMVTPRRLLRPANR